MLGGPLKELGGGEVLLGEGDVRTERSVKNDDVLVVRLGGDVSEYPVLSCGIVGRSKERLRSYKE